MFGKNKNGCFDCDNCPKNSDPSKGRHCVAWWETIETNIQNGEIKTVKACAWIQMPKYFIEVIKASNRPAAAVESTRNEIAKGFARLAESGPLMLPRRDN